MRQFVRGERAKLSDLAAINHIWQVEVSIDAPFFIVDFCCLGLDENGEVVDDRYLISYNQPDSPNDAIRMNNASNNGAAFTVSLGRLPDRVRRVVFTATLHEPMMPGGILGAAVSFFSGVNSDIGEGHLLLSTPAIDTGVFTFSGQDFGDSSTLILGELYWRDEWRFVAAGQPLHGELDDFLRTLTDGPLPAPAPKPVAAVKPVATVRPPMAAPPRQPRPVTAPTPKPPTPAPLTAAPSAPVVTPVRAPMAPPPAPAQPVAESIAPPVPTSPVVVAPVPAPFIPTFPQSLPPGGKLQDLIDVAAPSSTLTLMSDEYEGPITISKPLILEGHGSALWGRVGPIVTVAAADVKLHNLDIEITIAQDEGSEAGVALKVENQAPRLQLDNVRVRGRISGLGAEDGEWTLPSHLDLGDFAARAENRYSFSLRVPTSVKLSSPVEGVTLHPAEVGAGQHVIALTVREVTPETLIVGYVEVRSASLVRTIPLSGSALNGVAPQLDVELRP